MMQRNLSKVSSSLCCVFIKPILLAFPSFYTVESGFSRVHYSLSNQRSTLLIESVDLQLELTNLQPNICDLLSANQIYTSH